MMLRMVRLLGETRIRHRAALSLVLFVSLAAGAGEETQIKWVGEWEKAFKQAKADNKPVMVCINSIDTEVANNRAAKGTYKDAGFVAATRDFVMVVVSTTAHRTRGVCNRFGVITCQQHFDCWKELRAQHGETFISKAEKGKMISPQHAWFRPDGTLIRRKEYELSKAELLTRMRAVIKELHGNDATVPGAEKPAGEAPGKEVTDDRLKPLTEKEKAELVRAQKPGETNKESRRAALSNLLATEKVAVYGDLCDLLKTAPSEVKRDIISALGRADARDTLYAIHERLEKDKDDLVRSFAAVAIEQIGSAESIPFLIKRIKRERDTMGRKNMARALGVCGGGAKSKDAAKVLLKMINGDKQVAVRKHAAIACAGFKGEDASALVLKKLEKLALKLNDRSVRSGVIYALANIGSVETTVPVLEKLKERFSKNKNNWMDRAAVSFVRSAIRMVKGEGGDFGRAGRFLFEEDRNDPARE
jgi:HEAT repeat protein